MKICKNPDCSSGVFYSDEKSICPNCHGKLVISNGSVFGDYPILTADSLSVKNREEPGVDFIREGLLNVECHGRITEIDRCELFTGKGSKAYNSIFRGEPYQLSNQNIEYNIRLENISPGLATQVMDFSLLGNYLGRLQVGDEVFLRAKKRAGRRVVSYIYNCTTNSVIRPTSQLSAGFVKWWYALVIIFIISLIFGLIRFIESGAIVQVLTGIFVALLPIFMPIFIIWFIFRMIFPPRRR